MQISTGITTLDDMLDGGLPNDRTHLLVGGPGTGKSTLSMQYIQEGLDNGEECFYITTEQNRDELRDTFQSYDFDLDHENLTILIVHMEPDETFESDGKVPPLKTLEGEDTVAEGTNVPFNVEYITKYIEQSGDPDRIVFDSVSGLTPVVEESGSYRHSILELIRAFNDEMSATAIITAEERLDGGMDELSKSLAFNVHGVIRLWRQPKRGEDHHFIRIEKMRGIDHSKHRYEIEFGQSGLKIIPRMRTAPESTIANSAVSSQIEGLDRLLGGGLIPSRLNLILHDGRASCDPLLHKVLLELADQGYHGLYGPPSSMDYRTLNQAFQHQGRSLDNLLDNNDLTIFDTAGQEQRWKKHENIVQAQGNIAETVSTIEEGTENPLANIGHIDPVVTRKNPERAKKAWEKLRSTVWHPNNIFLYALNRKITPDWLTEYFIDQSVQTITTEVDATGLQYISVEKSIGGMNGYERIVEHRNEPPYIHIPD